MFFISLPNQQLLADQDVSGDVRIVAVSDDDDVIALEHYSGREDYEALAKSGSSISNDEILAMMRMVAKGPKP